MGCADAISERPEWKSDRMKKNIERILQRDTEIKQKLRILPGQPGNSGRPKGALNKATKEMRELAQNFGPEAITILLEIMREGESDVARIAAAKEILARGYGHPVTPLSGPDGDSIPVTFEGLTEVLKQTLDEIYRRSVEDDTVTVN